ncbi:MAG: hypothetical protein JST04_15395 [Bdellovibrionales bacterium]|nr:hypothetical protein [Bdellovibrionales bacterium]
MTRKGTLRFLTSGCFLVAAIVGLFACGSKKPAERTLLPGRDMGCYDKLGDRVTRFFAGAIEDAEWQDTFDCVNDQLTFFKKYVRGEAPEGYNQSDIGALVRKFLIVNRPISDAFISSIFDIKASVFGGSANVITPKEIDEFLNLSEVVRRESSALLPRLQAKRRSPNSANLLGLADQVNVFGTRIATYLRTLHGSIDVKKESFLPFARELIALHGGDPTLVDRYGDFIRNLKVVVSGGTSEVIEAGNWANLIQQGAAFGGLLFAYRDMEAQNFAAPGEMDAFEIELARRAQVAINQVIRLHGTGIPLEVFDPVIDTVPWDALTKEKREAIKHDLRPIIARALKGGVPGWLTASAVATVIDLFESGMKKQIHIRRIFATIPPSPDTKGFEAAARKYLDSFSPAGVPTNDRADVNALIAIAKSYVGLFPDGTGQMLFTNAMRDARTENHMVRMSWFRTLMQHVFSVYASGPTDANGRKLAQSSDLENLTEDFYQVLLQWKMAHPEMTRKEMAEKRFREANLFMPVSNGDLYMDDVEGTYYLAFLFSAGAFSSSVFSGVTHNARDWSACPITGKDELDQDAVDASCFRSVYFGHPDVFWANFPGLQKAYAGMNGDQRAELARSMETAARRGGYNEKPIGPYDVDSFAALPHYVEDIMANFDGNKDDVLDKSEILDKAYPIFKKTLAGAAPQAKSDFLLKGILTYIVKYGKAPSGTLDLLAWCARLRFTKVNADRASLYRVVALLSAPLEMSKNTTGSSWPGGSPNLFPTVVAR